MNEDIPKFRRKRLARQIDNYHFPKRLLRPRKIVMQRHTDDELTMKIPGFSRVFDNKSSAMARFIWLIISLALYGLCFYEIIGHVNEFMSEPVTSQKYYVHNNTVTFPTFTICEDYDFNNIVYLKLVLTEALKLNNFEEVDKLMKIGNITVLQLWDALGRHFANVGGYCLQNPENTKVFDVSKVYTIRGSCYSVSPKQNLQFTVGQLDVEIFQLFSEGYVGKGKAMIHSNEDFQLEKYFLNHDDIPFDMSGFSLYLMRIIQIIRTNTWKNPCNNGRRVTECLINCLKRAIYSTSAMTCRLPFMQEFEELPWCTSFESFFNTVSVIHKVTRSFQRSDCNCPPKCTENIYILTDDKLRFFETQVKSKSQRVGLKIRLYANRIRLYKEESKYGWMFFCGDIGGALGLSLGICGLQILDLLTACLSKKCWKQQKTQHGKPAVNILVKDLSTLEDDKAPVAMPGSEYVVRKDVPLLARLIWVIIFVVAGCFCIFQSREFVLHYLSNPTTRKTTYADSEHLTLPSLTVCPESDEYLPVINPTYFKKLFGEIFSFHRALDLLANGKLSINGLWNISRITSSDLIYLTRTDQGLLKGNVTHYATPTISGTCFTVVPNITVTTSVSTTVLFRRAISVGDYASASQLRLLIHDGEDILLVKYLPRLSGFAYSESVTPLLNIRIEKVLRHTSCQNAAFVAQCLVNCIERTIFSRSLLRCRLPYMQYDDSIGECLNDVEVLTIMNATTTTLQTMTLEECNCPKRCKETLYTINHHGPTPIGTFSLALLEFEDNRLEITEEFATYSVISLFCDIGGAVSLLLGLCGLTTVELVLYTLSKFTLNFNTYLSSKCRSKFHSKRNSVFKYANRESEEQHQVISVPGLNQAMKTNSSIWLRIGWFAIFLLAAGLCFYQCTDRIAYFWSDPSVVNTYYIENQTITFPMLILCPEKDVNQMVKNVGNHTISYLKGTWNQFSKFYEAEFKINEAPTTDVTISVLHTISGFCFIIQAKKPITYDEEHTSVFGTIYTTPNVYLNYQVFTINAQYSSDEFLQIPYDRKIHSQHSFNQLNGIRLAVHVVENIIRNTSHSPCDLGEAVSTCSRNKFEDDLFSSINKPCRLPFMQDSVPYPTCVTNEEILTVLNATFEHSLATNFNDPSSMFCPRKCKALWYTYEQVKTWPSVFPGGEPKIVFDVNFPHNRIYVMNEVAAYSFLNLLSDLGGTIGLYFGFGFLQICEIVAATFTNVFSRKLLQKPRRFFQIFFQGNKFPS